MCVIIYLETTHAIKGVCVLLFVLKLLMLSKVYVCVIICLETTHAVKGVCVLLFILLL